jgi:hypothetical protein
MYDANGILDVDQYRNTGAWFDVEFANLTDMLEYVAAQVLLYQEQHDVPLRRKRQAKKGLALLDAFAACIVDNGTSCCARFSRRVHDGLSLRIFNEGKYQLKVHGLLPLVVHLAL